MFICESSIPKWLHASCRNPCTSRFMESFVSIALILNGGIRFYQETISYKLNNSKSCCFSHLQNDAYKLATPWCKSKPLPIIYKTLSTISYYEYYKTQVMDNCLNLRSMSHWTMENSTSTYPLFFWCSYWAFSLFISFCIFMFRLRKKICTSR